MRIGASHDFPLDTLQPSFPSLIQIPPPFLAMENKYQYSELGTPRETRLIKLRTDVEQDAPLSCELVTTFMDTPDPYVALSYTWGNEIGRERMAVLSSGQALAEDAPAILVTPNCAAALRKLRASDLIGGRGVWVDAICINQNSNEDKSFQVEMMAEIYEKAAAVAVWLGEKWAPERYENVAASTAWYLNTVCKLPDGKGSTEFLIRRLKHHIVRLALRGICAMKVPVSLIRFPLTRAIRH